MRRAGLVLALALTLAGCGGDGEPEARPAEGGCRDVSAPAGARRSGPRPPHDALAPGVTHSLVFATSCGAFTVELDPQAAPRAAAALVALARTGFFDGTTIHRVVPGFVIQGGDPTGTGTGGPGYSTVDEPPGDARYTAGVVAMAKAADDPAGTAGSQFFVVTAEDAGLPPIYAVVGRVVEGMGTVRRIEALGDVQSQRPSRTILVDSVTAESPG